MSSKDRFLAAAVVIAGVALGVVWLESSAHAQDAGASPAKSPAKSTADGVLGDVLEERAAGNDAAVAVQKQVDELSDQTSDLMARYRTTIKQIEAIDLYNSQMREMIASQERELASLRDQVGRVEEVSRSVTPLMIRMIAAIEKFVELDVPFLIDERTERIQDLKRMMDRADVTTSEKFRQIMEAYQTEIEFGRTIEAYRGPLKVGDTEETVDFLRFGRIALVYLSLDESEAGVWSQDKGGWVPLDDSLKSSIRAGLRIARKQTAPDLIKVPLPAATEAPGRS
jgi:hypothetical protein